MVQLYHIPGKGQAGKIEEVLFPDEIHHLPPFIEENPWVLGEGVKIICKRIGEGPETDFLALDRSDAKPKFLIVEAKIKAEADIIAQILRYVDWFVCNPYIVGLRLKEYGIESTDIDLAPRLTVVAPTICDELVNLAQYIQGFEWDFVEIHRFSDRSGLFIVVTHRLARKETPKPWYREVYRVLWRYEEGEIELGKRLLERVFDFAKEKGWEPKTELLMDKDGYGEWVLNEGFGIGPSKKIFDTPGWYLWFELPKEPTAMQFSKVINSYPHKWDEPWFYVDLPSSDVDFGEFETLFRAAYKYVVE